MSKTMSQTIRGHNLRVTMVVAVLAAMLLVLTLVVVVQTSPTTGGSANRANHAMSADGSGGSSITQDPTSSATPRWLPATMGSSLTR